MIHSFKPFTLLIALLLPLTGCVIAPKVGESFHQESPNVGEPFQQEEWNNDHSPSRFNLTGKVSEGVVYEAWREGFGPMHNPHGILVKDGIVVKLLNTEEFRRYDSEASARRDADNQRLEARRDAEYQQAKEEIQDLITNRRSTPAYMGDFVPVREPPAGSPLVKGFFLGMPIEQAVDVLNQMVISQSAAGAETQVKDYTPDSDTEFKKLNSNTILVDGRIVLECPDTMNNGFWVDYGLCSTDKYYVIKRNKRTKPMNQGNGDTTFFKDIYPNPRRQGIKLSFDDTGHLDSFTLEQKVFDAQGMSLKDFALEFFRAYNIPVSASMLFGGATSKLDQSNIGKVVNFYVEDRGYEYQTDSWRVRVSTDNLSSTSVWVGRLSPTPVPSFN